MDNCYQQNENVRQLVSWLHKSHMTVILTGAGMSTESGIPDFRSAKGWWNKTDPAQVATIDALLKNYDLFREFYSYRLKGLGNCLPHEGHYILASWERRGLISCITTQNVDGLHQAAGSKRVYELHGSIKNISCYQCGKKSSQEDFLSGKTCTGCGGKLRPGVVLFGEALPEYVWEKAVSKIRESELLIIIGSSLKVSPVNHLPLIAGGHAVIINNEDTELDNKFDLVINGNALKVLKQIDNEIMKSLN